MRDKILKAYDQEVVGLLIETMKKLDLTLVMKEQFTKVVKLDSGLLEVHTNTGNTYQAEIVMVALGRPSNIDVLGLDKLGIKLQKNGFIEVDEYQNTNVEGVYAIGDVTTADI